jgi:MYXO-CTERM domain-containing protein
MICQPQDVGSPACLPKCTIRTSMSGMMFDSCVSDGSSLACDLDSGVCGGPVTPPVMDAGVDGGIDAGMELDAGHNDDAGMMMMMAADAGPPVANGNLGKPASGCGCSAATPLPFALGLLLLAARRKRS